MQKKILASVLALILSFGMTDAADIIHTAYAANKEKSAADYTYTITPLLAPFNEYFFVKTDNPEPMSFRFADKSSKYSEKSSIHCVSDIWDENAEVYEDVVYEDKKIARVNGGYIFQSYDTDGGEVTLQFRGKDYYGWEDNWTDTNVSIELPELKDSTDYLIDTYANKSDFFDNMDAVQEGFDSICLYSGSYIRGPVIKTGDYWSVSAWNHKDQSFYIFSPYDRQDSKHLFATAIYPFRYDSLGFPSVMATVSQRLSDSSSYKWNSDVHYLVDVTYNNETKSYGGAGNGEGQGISADKIKENFTFDNNQAKLNLKDSKELLEYYAQIEMPDDIPREDELTWKMIYDKVGSGSWAKVGGGYSFLYQKGDGTDFSSSEWGVGYQLYWGGDLGYASDTWVDGRYVDDDECFVEGEKFEDHPTSDILLKDIEIPQIKYNSKTESYDVTIKKKTVCFNYQDDAKEWQADWYAFDSGCEDYNDIVRLAENNDIDKKYLDMVRLTPSQVKDLKVDRNTNKYFDDCLIYNGFAEPGSTLKNHKHNYESVDVDPTCKSEGYTKHTCLICDDSYIDNIIAKVKHEYGEWQVTKEPTTTETGLKERVCYECGEKETKVIPTLEYTEPTDSTVIAPKMVNTTSTNNSVKVRWNAAKNVDGYIITTYCDGKKVKSADVKNATVTTVNGLRISKNYLFGVKSYKMVNGKKVYGKEVGLKASTLPSAPKLTVKAGKKSAKLSWKKVPNATRYEVYMKEGKSYKKVAAVKGTSFTKKGLKSGVKYSFKIKTIKVANFKADAKYGMSKRTKIYTSKPSVIKAVKVK